MQPDRARKPAKHIWNLEIKRRSAKTISLAKSAKDAKLELYKKSRNGRGLCELGVLGAIIYFTGCELFVAGTAKPDSFLGKPNWQRVCKKRSNSSSVENLKRSAPL
jgi:hypothetical protein